MFFTANPPCNGLKTAKPSTLVVIMGISGTSGK
jgi:hypothetical protein